MLGISRPSDDTGRKDCLYRLARADQHGKDHSRPCSSTLHHRTIMPVSLGSFLTFWPSKPKEFGQGPGRAEASVSWRDPSPFGMGHPCRQRPRRSIVRNAQSNKSVKQGLNLSRSQQQGYSAAYNTPFKPSRLQVIYPFRYLKL